MKIKKYSILFAFVVLLASVLACGSSAPAGVSNVYMANDADGNNKTTTFASTDIIYVFFDVNQVESGAQFQIKWYALNIEGQDPAEAFLVTDYTYTGEAVVFAQMESTQGGFPAGQYKVEIYLNGAKVGEQPFTIQ
ncbi:MAG: hypothetical protein H7Y59_07795 [Anaerolineales bacterium]|nr:hypothetical protein [Anaerolineales bacterium]